MTLGGFDLGLEPWLAFVGFGNPAGRFWSIGMEERGTGSPEELAWRRTFAPVEDLIEAHLRRNTLFPAQRPFASRTPVPNWALMSKLVLRLEGDPRWAERLGRLEGETFLTDLLPMPSESLAHSPHGAQVADRAALRHQVLDERLARLWALFDRHQPPFVACLGKGNWADHERLFPEAHFVEQVPGRVPSMPIPFANWLAVTNCCWSGADAKLARRVPHR